MREWFRTHVYEINFFVAGFCASAALSSIATGNYGLAALNAVLVYVNIRLAKQ
jgi:hypothetical protein